MYFPRLHFFYFTFILFLKSLEIFRTKWKRKSRSKRRRKTESTFLSILLIFFLKWLIILFLCVVVLDWIWFNEHLAAKKIETLCESFLALSCSISLQSLFPSIFPPLPRTSPSYPISLSLTDFLLRASCFFFP